MKLSWEDVDKFIAELTAHIEYNWRIEYKGVYGPPRGGLPLAVMLSHRLNLPLLQTPCMGCIIIDDIADTGETLNKYADNTDIVTMVYHPNCSYTPKYYKFTKGDDWVIFPWE